MKPLASFLLDSANAGVYATPASTAALQQAAVNCGLAWLELDLAGVTDKGAFLACCQTALGLLSSFGHNWDALSDSLQDLSWQPARGYIVQCRNGAAFVRSSPQDFAIALEIFAAAAAYWSAKNKVFVVLLDAETRGCHELKRVPA